MPGPQPEALAGNPSGPNFPMQRAIGARGAHWKALDELNILVTSESLSEAVL